MPAENSTRLTLPSLAELTSDDQVSEAAEKNVSAGSTT
jgi:hypothetical protein